MTIEDFENAVSKYGLKGMMKRCTVDGEHCKTYFQMREDGKSEKELQEFHDYLVLNYPVKSERLLFMKVFMGGFVLSTDK